MTKHKKAPNIAELEQQIGELTQDLQRTRADFENYRKRVDAEKAQAKAVGTQQAIRKLLPVIDTIERATANVPKKLQNDTWASGVVAMSKKLDGLMAEFKLEPIVIELGTTEFDPDLHEAVSMVTKKLLAKSCSAAISSTAMSCAMLWCGSAGSRRSERDEALAACRNTHHISST